MEIIDDERENNANIENDLRNLDLDNANEQTVGDNMMIVPPNQDQVQQGQNDQIDNMRILPNPDQNQLRQDQNNYDNNAQVALNIEAPEGQLNPAFNLQRRIPHFLQNRNNDQVNRPVDALQRAQGNQDGLNVQHVGQRNQPVHANERHDPNAIGLINQQQAWGQNQGANARNVPLLFGNAWRGENGQRNQALRDARQANRQAAGGLVNDNIRADVRQGQNQGQNVDNQNLMPMQAYPAQAEVLQNLDVNQPNRPAVRNNVPERRNRNARPVPYNPRASQIRRQNYNNLSAFLFSLAKQASFVPHQRDGNNQEHDDNDENHPVP